VPDAPVVRDDAAGLRAANARLRELLAERDAQLAAQAAAAAELREQVAGLQAQVADLAARLGQNSGNSASAVLGRPREAGAEVAAEEDGPQARQAEGAAGRDDAAERLPGPRGAA
jgi:hypothetical protein